MSATDTLANLTPVIKKAWFIVCASGELKRGLLKRRLWGEDLVVYRDGSGKPHVVVDRCPHRSVPLHLGKVVDGQLQCGYHGWRFGEEGRCVAIPGLVGEPDHPARRATWHATREQQGWVWIWAEPGVEPEVEPYVFEEADQPGYLTVRKTLQAKGSLHAVLENALDVPHTAYLHGGLFRNEGGDKTIQCTIRRSSDRVTCTFEGEERPEGLVARLLSPSGGEIAHTDTFILPSISRVEYRLGDENHVVLYGIGTPEDLHETAYHAVICVKSRLPNWLVQPLVQPIALRIFAQDAVMLEAQTRTLHRTGEVRFASTEIDLLGTHILRLMHQAAKGVDPDPEKADYVRRTTLQL